MSTSTKFPGFCAAFAFSAARSVVAQGARVVVGDDHTARDATSQRVGSVRCRLDPAIILLRRGPDFRPRGRRAQHSRRGLDKGEPPHEELAVGVQPGQVQSNPAELLVLSRVRRPVENEALEVALRRLHFDAICHQTHDHVQRRALEHEELELRLVHRLEHALGELAALHRDDAERRALGDARTDARGSACRTLACRCRPDPAPKLALKSKVAAMLEVTVKCAGTPSRWRAMLSSSISHSVLARPCDRSRAPPDAMRPVRRNPKARAARRTAPLLSLMPTRRAPTRQRRTSSRLVDLHSCDLLPLVPASVTGGGRRGRALPGPRPAPVAAVVPAGG